MSDQTDPPERVRDWVDSLLGDLQQNVDVDEADPAQIREWVEAHDPPECVLEWVEEMDSHVDDTGGDVTHPSRVRAWTQNFLDADDNELMMDVGRNFEYLLDHVADWEDGDLSHADLPALDEGDRWLQMRCASFGSRLAAGDSTAYVVSDADGAFIGLFGHEENARERAADADGAVESVTPTAPDPREYVEKILDVGGDEFNELGETFAFIVDEWDAFKAGDVSPDDYPHFDQNTKWFIGYSVLFGMLWELSHPSLHAVFDGDQRFLDLFWDPRAAAAFAGVEGDHYAQRVSVVDGDLPPEDVIGTIGPGLPDGDGE